MSSSEAISEPRTKESHESDNDVHSLHDPLQIVSDFNQLYNHWRTRQSHNPDETSIFVEDWDDPLILDACRYDEYTHRSNLPSKIKHRISRGSTSPEFVCGNFDREYTPDIITEDVEPFFDDLLGKTVVTADHGEFLGDRGRLISVALYRHPESDNADIFIKTHCPEYQNDERRSIVTEQSMEMTDNSDIEQIEQNRRNLSYRTYHV